MELKECKCITAYIKLQCPHCEAPCIIDVGNPDTDNEPGFTSIKCHKCGRLFLLPGDSRFIHDQAGAEKDVCESVATI